MSCNIDNHVKMRNLNTLLYFFTIEHIFLNNLIAIYIYMYISIRITLPHSVMPYFTCVVDDDVLACPKIIVVNSVCETHCHIVWK